MNETTSPAPSPLRMAKFTARPADAPQRRATHTRGTHRPDQSTSRLRRPVDLDNINREPRDPATIIFTPHFRDQMLAKGITTKQVGAALANPYKVTDVLRYPGQVRYCSEELPNGLPGIAVVVEGDTAITLYLDGVVTQRRSDQDDEAALSSRRLASLR